MNQDSLNQLVDSLTRSELGRISNTASDVSSQTDYLSGTLVVLFVLAIVASPFIISYFYGRSEASWDKGIIPKDFEPTEQNVFEIFIAAACAIVVRDLDNYYRKFPYIDKFLSENFGSVYYHAAESYDYSMRHIVKMDSLADWSNQHLSEALRIKMINFLAGIAAYDGGINEDEQRYLLALMSKLGLKLNNFDAVYREKITRKNEQRYQTRPNASQMDLFYSVLGLEKSASMEEVKAAYRRLVKLTHPDRFAKESPEVQKQMSEKFREIQAAYESLTSKLSNN
ncbi:DnaJ domain-containing protein [Fluviicola sp.]|uniref:J domain-containing protein n=1 Tax=Fluviicola sp. TaxID=1917219 RepID=UPI0026127062|nr:DnaJ domain-containing protein [Fluviicola sp.]